MKIGYDIDAALNIHGTGTYANNLLQNLKELNNDLELIGFEYAKFYKNRTLLDRAKKFTLRNMFLCSGDPY